MAGAIKVLLIASRDGVSGPGLAAGRLLQALRAQGTDATMLVLHKDTGDASITEVAPDLSDRLQQSYMLLREKIDLRPNLFRWRDVHRFTIGKRGLDINDHPAVQAADILHLHHFNYGFLSLRSLRQLRRLGKPIVWTLSDMWPFTGGCHYTGACDHYTARCGVCPLLAHPRPRDLSHRTWQRKVGAYTGLDLHLVATSNWLARHTKASSLLGDVPLWTIPHPLEPTLYAPGDKAQARQRLGLPEGVPLVLFLAHYLDEPRKGYNLLRQALELLPNDAPKPHLVLLGKTRGSLVLPKGIITHNLGWRTGADVLAAYRAADALAVPSLETNLPNPVLEATAALLPVVGFATGGIPELIKPGEAGWLVPTGDTSGLALALAEAIGNPDKAYLFATAARERLIRNHNPANAARQYQAVYQVAASP